MAKPRTILARTDVWLALASLGLIACLAGKIFALMNGLAVAPSDEGRAVLGALGDLLKASFPFLVSLGLFLVARRLDAPMISALGVACLGIGALVLASPWLFAFGRSLLIWLVLGLAS
ncbi:MAG: hypothetical protein ACRED4_01705 [Brevundimonas sp.]